jgi:hypothetical protein
VGGYNSNYDKPNIRIEIPINCKFHVVVRQLDINVSKLYSIILVSVENVPVAHPVSQRNMPVAGEITHTLV